MCTRPQILDALQRAQAVTTKSAALRSRIIAEGIPADRIRVTQNGVDSRRFTIRDRDTSARVLDLPRDQRRLVFVGKLEPIKGLPFLLKAFASIAAHDPRLNLYVVGDGFKRVLYERTAADIGLASRVRFVGAQHPALIPVWLGAAELLCMPSLNEGCPNVVLEALASGRPVVASEVGAVPDLLTRATGMIVRPAMPWRLPRLSHARSPPIGTRRSSASTCSGCHGRTPPMPTTRSTIGSSASGHAAR